jgi:hypothetical protein
MNRRRMLRRRGDRGTGLTSRQRRVGVAAESATAQLEGPPTRDWTSGAGGYRPNTLASYDLAARLGATSSSRTWCPLDMCWCAARERDRVPPTYRYGRFTGRRTTKVVDGVTVTGWLTEDSPLADSQDAARGGAPAGGASTQHPTTDCSVPTFDEPLSCVPG